MPDPKQLPHLLKLLEDESPFVQKTVLRELATFGSSLKSELEQLAEPPSPAQKLALQRILEEDSRAWLKFHWLSWKKLPTEIEKLEGAHALICGFQDGMHRGDTLKKRLDRLAEEFRSHGFKFEPFSLIEFLFRLKGIQGARGDYYNAKNSNLIHAMQSKRGIPITLVHLFMLVGHRLGMEIQGCNFPGHFLARCYVENRMYLIDCYEGGRVVDMAAFADVDFDTIPDLQTVMEGKPSTETMVTRVLRNLLRAYEERAEYSNATLMEELLEQQHERTS